MKSINNFFISSSKNAAVVIVMLMLFAFIPVSAESSSHEEVISQGAKTYYRFCSVCHGEDAKGDGTFSENIKVPPPSLTQLSKNNNGVFPWVDLYAVIDGTDITKAHGTKEMPIWGELFDLNQWSSSNIENANTIVHGRIFELLMYLHSIQEEKD